MAKVTNVLSSRTRQTCDKCRIDLPVGSPYRWAKPRVHRAAAGRKLVRCMKFRCNFRQSDLTTSKMAGVYAAQENLTEAMEGDFTPNDLLGSLQAAADEVRGVGEEYQEGAENIEEGFGHETSQSVEMAEKAEALEEYAARLEEVTIDDADEYDELEEEGALLNEKDEDRRAEIEERQTEIREEAANLVNEATEELSI